MGTDIYTYCVDEINGKVIKISFQSGQSVGLAPDFAAGDASSKKLESAAHWVCALAEHDQAFRWVDGGRRVPNCALTRHARWRQPTGNVTIKGGFRDFKDLQVMLKDSDHGSYGTSSSSEGTMKASVDFRSVDKAQVFIDEWNDKERNGEIVSAYFENLVDGPEYIDQYSRPKEDFEGFIEDVTTIEIEYDCKDEAEGYWNTAATYRIAVKDEAYLEHVSEGDEWAGR